MIVASKRIVSLLEKKKRNLIMSMSVRFLCRLDIHLSSACILVPDKPATDCRHFRIATLVFPLFGIMF